MSMKQKTKKRTTKMYVVMDPKRESMMVFNTMRDVIDYCTDNPQAYYYDIEREEQQDGRLYAV